MKKRIFYTLLTIILTFFFIITNTYVIFMIEIAFIYSISYIVYILFRFFHSFLINKYYKDLIKTMKDIEKIKNLRYKSYFLFSGVELEEKMQFWNECLITNYDYLKVLIEFLKDNFIYLSLEKYYNVLEIEKEVRNTSRL